MSVSKRLQCVALFASRNLLHTSKFIKAQFPLGCWSNPLYFLFFMGKEVILNFISFTLKKKKMEFKVSSNVFLVLFLFPKTKTKTLYWYVLSTVNWFSIQLPVVSSNLLAVVLFAVYYKNMTWCWEVLTLPL